LKDDLTMQLKLKKSQLVNLSLDEHVLPMAQTADVAGGIWARWTVTAVTFFMDGDQGGGGGGGSGYIPPYPGEGLPPP
jgi:hypothetical protein